MNFVFGQFGDDNVVSNMDVSVSSIAADIDNDGDLDLIHMTSALNASKISYFLNLGAGVFGNEIIISTAIAADAQLQSPNKVLAADLNNDGLIDVISISNVDKKLAWYRNIDGVNFDDQQVIHTFLFGPNDMDVGDINNDGSIDIVAINFSNSMSFQNNGVGVFGSETIISTLSSVRSIQCVDMDNDGKLDVLTASAGFGDTVAWVKNLGNFVFGNQTVVTTAISDPVCAFADDIDNDGDADVLVGSIGSDAVYRLLNAGNGTFGSVSGVATSVIDPTGIKTADIDGDSDKDIIFGSFGSSSLKVYKNQGGFWSNSSPSVSNSKWRTLFDYDNDGDIDIVNSNRQTLSIYNNNGTGAYSFYQSLNQPFLKGCNMIATDDMDGDGDADIIATSLEDSTIVLYENLGGGVFTPQKFITNQFSEAESVYLIDLDNDNDLDIYTGSVFGANAGWIENLSNLNFGTFQEISGTDASWGAVAADLNGDLLPDLVYARAFQNKITWYQNLGNGSFGPEQIISTLTLRPNSVAASDIDGDGDLDIVSSSYNDGKIAWYMNMGGGSFGPQQIISSNSLGPLFVKTSDFNNDGYQDVVYTSNLDDKIVWHANNGSGVFGAEQIISLSQDLPVHCTPADIDNDGDMDLIAISNTDDELMLYENIGNGNFSSAQTISQTAMYGQSCAVIDIDGDSDMDIVYSCSGGFNVDYGKVAWFGNQEYSPYQARGELYIDANDNGVRDSQEEGMQLIQITSTPQSNYAFSYTSGNYFMNFNNANNVSYTLAPNIPQNWEITSDSLSYTFMMNAASNVVDSLDFGFHPSLLIDSVNVELVGSFAVCNDTINYWLFIENKGTTIASGVVYINLNNDIDFINSTPAPDSIVGQKVYWSYDSLSYFNHILIPIQVEMPDVSVGAAQLYSSLTHLTIDSLGLFSDTTSTFLNHGIVCAYDPNDKIANPAGIDSMGYISPSTEFIEYTIRFQNTGTYIANDIVITDYLDTNLVWNSITPLAYSHPMNISVAPSGLISFNFPNIQLVDSSVSQLESQGFVKYRIDLKQNLPLGTSIYNTANIYFDLNPAIQTNTKIHTLYDCQGEFEELIPSSLICYGSNINYTPTPDSSFLSFDIVGVYNQYGHSFEWLADTSGVFDVNLQMTNDICTIDSTFQINVLPENIPLSLPDLNLCAGDSIQVFGIYQSQAGVFSDTIASSNGCDSIIHQELVINSENFETLPTSFICFGDSSLIFNSYENSSGIYYDSLLTIQGCDSIIQKELMVYPVIPNYNMGSSDICEGDSLMIFGSYQNTSGVYYDSLLSINGCDSLIYFTLTEHSNPSVSLENFLNDTICIYNSPFQLPNGIPSGGIYVGQGVENSNMFNPSVANIGMNIITYSYSDVIGCTGTDSISIFVDGCASLSEIENRNIQISPNPFKDNIQVIASDFDLNKSIFILYDTFGKIVLEGQLDSTGLISCPYLSKGNYIIEIRDKSKVLTRKNILKH